MAVHVTHVELEQGLITANLTFVFSVLKFGIPLMTHLNLRVVLASKIS